MERKIEGRRVPGHITDTQPKCGSVVLDRQTAHVSPSFHVKFDSTFDTAKQITSKSQWEIKAGFVAQREPKQVTTTANRYPGFSPRGSNHD
jgi:hypothetical protein